MPEIKREAGIRSVVPPLRPKLLPMWGCPVKGCSAMSPKKHLVEEHIKEHHTEKPKEQ